MDVSACSLNQLRLRCRGASPCVRDYPDKKLVKVYEVGARPAACKHCGEPVTWYRTVNRERFMLFNGGAVALKTGQHHETHEALLYLDREECHWERCASQQ